MPSSQGALCLNPATLRSDPVQRQALFIPAASAEALLELQAAAEREHAKRDQGAVDAMNERVSRLLTPLMLS
jgi:hypothetical protein